jgi:molecular chaperone GrpE
MSSHGPTAAELEARVEVLEAELAGAFKRLDDVEAERQEYLSDLQRVAAEFDNFRKRAVREREALVSRATERLIRALLPVLDDLDRAVEHASGGDAKLAEGVSLVGKHLRGALEKEGLVEIDTSGTFDPHVHEALLSQPSEQPEGSIVEVLQKGFRLGDVVVRPARVAVAAPAGRAQARGESR